MNEELFRNQKEQMKEDLGHQFRDGNKETRKAIIDSDLFVIVSSEDKK